jgi:hypothetical protein
MSSSFRIFLKVIGGLIIGSLMVSVVIHSLMPSSKTEAEIAPDSLPKRLPKPLPKKIVQNNVPDSNVQDNNVDPVVLAAYKRAVSSNKAIDPSHDSAQIAEYIKAADGRVTEALTHWGDRAISDREVSVYQTYALEGCNSTEEFKPSILTWGVCVTNVSNRMDAVEQ